MVFGGWIEEELDKIKAKTDAHLARKRTAKLKALLSDDPKKHFADPAALFK